MPTKPQADRRTLQDDRAELDADPGAESPLVKGEGAPLAQDGAVGTAAEQSEGMPLPLGGPPVPSATDLDSPERLPARHEMTAADDRPIND